ncbi:MAG: tetratricopeptide repeat protein, partial [Isosphaeraceae bacterium]|nr:tetratricopeptide repeat protein [Isosphaeraceae bacterium]
MLFTARVWKKIGSWALGGVLLAGGSAVYAEDAPSLSGQLAALGRQALQQGQADQAQTFFRKALQLDPTNAEARRGLGDRAGVRRVALQDADKPAAEAPAPDAPAPAAEPLATPAAPEAERPRATIEAEERLAEVRRQQLVTDVEQRLQRAHDFVAEGNPEAALNT